MEIHLDGTVRLQGNIITQHIRRKPRLNRNLA